MSCDLSGFSAIAISPGGTPQLLCNYSTVPMFSRSWLAQRINGVIPAPLSHDGTVTDHSYLSKLRAESVALICVSYLGNDSESTAVETNIPDAFRDYCTVRDGAR